MRGYWHITDHVCGLCLGRVALSAAAPHVARCTNCERRGEAVGPKAGSVCACRIRIGARDAGIRCVPNPNPRPEMPGHIIAKEID